MPSSKKAKPGKPRERWSSLVYPEQICDNPNCLFDKKFFPHDKRQFDCCPQCGSHKRNNEASEANKTIYGEEKVLREMDKKMDMLFEKFNNGKHCLVYIEYFRLMEIDLRYRVLSEKNPATGVNILWLYRYGTELHARNPYWIYIIKRPLNQIK